MKKALFIVGPTAVGKTDLALNIAGRVPSVLISADSVQVYRGANVIAGKDLPLDAHFVDDHFETENTAIYLLDCNSPFESFSVRNFIDRATPVIKQAEENNLLPIIVGGTGLYADALYRPIDTLLVEPNEDLREELEDFAVEELQERLRKVDPERLDQMNNSDLNNKRRLVRAIEVAGLPKSKSTPVFFGKDFMVVGLEMPMERLREKIKLRVENRMEMGALDEARELFKDYEKLALQLKTANGYKELFAYCASEMSLEKAVERWITADYQHAKSQMTWFKKKPEIMWFEAEYSGKEKRIAELVQNFSS